MSIMSGNTNSFDLGHAGAIALHAADPDAHHDLPTDTVGLIAGTTQTQAGGLQLVDNVNTFITVDNDNDSTTLPSISTVAVGEKCTIIHDGLGGYRSAHFALATTEFLNIADNVTLEEMGLQALAAKSWILQKDLENG